jgi:hypothetical protein
MPFKPSVGFGIESLVSKSVRPIRTVQSENPTDRISEIPTGMRFLSKQTLNFEEISVTCHAYAYTEFNSRNEGYGFEMRVDGMSLARHVIG